MIRDSTALANFRTPLEEMLPCRNGVIDLRTGEFEPNRQKDYLLKASPVEWQGIDAPCPLWEKSLLEIFSEKRPIVD